MPIVLALAAAVFVALGLRLRGVAATILAGYVAVVTQFGLLTWALSPFRAVTMTGLLVGELVLLAGAVGFWWARGRPGVELAAARSALRAIATDPVTLAFVAVAFCALAYELVLVLTAPPTNWDSLTYHLTRVAAWHQVHGIRWIPNAPTGRLNEFQLLAEQEIFFLFVATGSTIPFAVPQYVAELAILVAVFGTARRLGYSARASACAACVLATFTLIALESSTAQNDLVSASFPIAAACLLLAGGQAEAAVAGVAIALGLGVKLTTALTLPVLVWLIWLRGRQSFKPVILGGAFGVVTVTAWGFVQNLVHTGHVLGYGQGRVEDAQSSFSVPVAARTALHFVFRLVDLGVISHWLIVALAAAGVVTGVAAVVWKRRLAAAAVALPFLCPLVVLGVLSAITGEDPAFVPRAANEDFSAFGPIGTGLLFGTPILSVLAYRARRADKRHLALAAALPLYIVLLAFYAKYNVWTPRFLIVPVVLIAPLFAFVFRNRLVTAAVVVVAGIVVTFSLVDDANKRLNRAAGPPWSMSEAQALTGFSAEPTGRIVAGTLVAYDRAVPETACVGAVLDSDEPAYLLWGPDLRRRVYFLPSLAALQTAYGLNLEYVVVSTGANAPVAKQFSSAGWTVRPIGQYWQLAIAPPAKRVDSCRA